MPTTRKIIPLHQGAVGGEPVDAGRRRFIHLMAASAALAGTACSGPPAEDIVPYVRMPEALLPGEPAFYATTLVRHGRWRGCGLGVLVENNMGRPTKVEGNTRHPASRGATDVFAQAAVLDFWDPDRSRAPRQGNAVGSWSAAETALRDAVSSLAARSGEGLRILTPATTSQSFRQTWQAVRRRYPAARWHRHDPLADDGAAVAAQIAFGRPVDSLFHFERARVVVSFAADFLSSADWSNAIACAADFAKARRQSSSPPRLYAASSVPGLVDARADQTLSLAPAQLEATVWRLAARLGGALGQALPAAAAPATVAPQTAAWERATAEALLGARGAGLIVAGPQLSAPTRALVHVLNDWLGNAGNTVEYIDPVGGEDGFDSASVSASAGHADSPGEEDSLAALCEDMRAGRVDTLLMLGGNPVYDAPADLDFAGALLSVPQRFHAGLYRDETALQCHWHLPLAHAFEHWDDARAADGTASIVQPLIAPLYGARSAREILGWLGDGQMTDYAAVRAALAQTLGASVGADFEAAWRIALRTGVIADSASSPRRVVADAAFVLAQRPPPGADNGLTAIFLPDPSVADGRYANNAWLQELPRPRTTLTWDNAAMVSPATAAALGVVAGEIVTLSVGDRSLVAPIWLLPGQAPGTIGLPLGYGRRAAGRVGNGVGFDAYAIRTRRRADVAPVTLTDTGRTHVFACRQPGRSMMGRPLAREQTVGDSLQEGHEKEAGGEHEAPSLYPAYEYPEHAWAMSIDLDACIGCGVCTIACQAENNIPVVGKEEVRHGREMHWLRVDRYDPATQHTEVEDDASARLIFQPVPCMHCENAPCEPVCPVGATMHDSEGINVQVYNRCVGTRYCSNNCPYKVRRFNFLQYSDTEDGAESLKAGRNPEVTVRQRGVMEKCNYCLQRISRARISAEREGRDIADGEVVTACEAACPTQAIVFGDLRDRGSRVNHACESRRHYVLLEELNTRPRTTYLTRLRNADPALAGGKERGDA